jgi:hypothetical protein
MTSKERARILEKAIKLTLLSLESHLPYTYVGKRQAFHRACVKEYTMLLTLLSKLY